MVVTCVMTLVTSIGPENQKGTITGIFRSLGALARAGGPVLASTGKQSLIETILINKKLRLSCSLKKLNEEFNSIENQTNDLMKYDFSVLEYWKYHNVLNWGMFFDGSTSHITHQVFVVNLNIYEQSMPYFI